MYMYVDRYVGRHSLARPALDSNRRLQKSHDVPKRGPVRGHGSEAALHETAQQWADGGEARGQIHALAAPAYSGNDFGRGLGGGPGPLPAEDGGRRRRIFCALDTLLVCVVTVVSVCARAVLLLSGGCWDWGWWRLLRGC